MNKYLETLKKQHEWKKYLSNQLKNGNPLSTRSRPNNDGISTSWRLKWENLNEKEIRDRLTHDRRIIATIDTLPKNIGGTLHERNRTNPNNHNGDANHPVS